MRLSIVFFALGSLLILIPLIYSVYDSFPACKERTGVVIQWKALPSGFGYNIFFKDGKTLFINGENPRFTNFLKNLTLHKTYTFKYYVETYSEPLSSSPSYSFNHIIAVLDENNTILYKDDSYQNLKIELSGLSYSLIIIGILLIFFGFLIKNDRR